MRIRSSILIVALFSSIAMAAALSAWQTVSAAGRASVGDYGFDATGMDLKVRPGDDFNQFANGSWVRQANVPADRSSWGVWDVLEEQAQAHMRAILEAAARAHAPLGSNTQKIGDYYGAFMDEATIEKLGATPLKRQLAAARSIRSYTELAAAMGRALRVGESMPISLSVEVDFKNPDTYSVYADQGGLGLPDRDYYLQDDDAMKAARAAYLDYVTKLLLTSKLAATRDEAARRTQRVFELEHRLAEIQWTRVQQRDLVARYKPWQQSEYSAKAPGLDWGAFFKAAGVGGQPMIVASVDSAIIGSAAVFPTVPLPVWRDYMAIRAIDKHAPYLSNSFVEAHFAYHETALSGTPAQRPRWKRGVQFSEKALGEAIAPAYVEKYFSNEAKVAARLLVANLIGAAGKRIEALDWMSAATKDKAHQKLSALGVKIGYPDNWRDYSKLRIVAGQAYQNALAADRFEYDRNLAKLGQPVDHTEWEITPMTINAYYNPFKNEIVFPAAVLQPPFFDASADPAVNYGGIGAIIGHEISHGFDDQGRLFDAHGAMTDWWTEADAAKYKQRTAALVAQYSAYEVLPGVHLNGELTLGENIADNAGLVIAYDAYHASLQGRPAPVIDGQSGDQRFFLGFAQSWRTIWREPILRQLTATDPHAPDAIRVRTVRNFDAWYDAYDVQTGNSLYLAPADRVRIW
jgi:putative endopeptidase